MAITLNNPDKPQPGDNKLTSGSYGPTSILLTTSSRNHKSGDTRLQRLWSPILLDKNTAMLSARENADRPNWQCSKSLCNTYLSS